MSLYPLLSASPVIQIHAYAAIAAFVLGAFVLFEKKGGKRHKALGRLWVGLMVIAAASSLFIWVIRTWGLFSPIHVISVVTLAGLWRAVTHARARNIAAHRALMRNLYLGALVIAGVFTFYPGRIMNRVVFGSDGASPQEWVVFAAVLLALGACAFVIANRRWLVSNLVHPAKPEGL